MIDTIKKMYYHRKAKAIIKKRFNDFYRDIKIMTSCSEWANIPYEILMDEYYKIVIKRSNKIIKDAHDLAKNDRIMQANELLSTLYPDSYEFKLVITSK